MHYLCQECQGSFPLDQLFLIYKQIGGKTRMRRVCPACKKKHDEELEMTRQNFQAQFGEKIEAEVAQTKLITKICIFSDKDAANVQKWVNDFIKDKKVIDVKYQSVVINDFPNGSAVVDRVLVIYEEEE